MAKSIKVSASIVRKYFNHSAVCSSWKSAIRSKFDLFSSEEFTVDLDFIKQGLGETSDRTLKAMIEADFGAHLKAASGVVLAQKTAKTSGTAVIAGVEIAGASAKNSKFPEAVGKGLYLDGKLDFLVRKTKKGNWLIVPVEKTGAAAPANFQLLSNAVR